MFYLNRSLYRVLIVFLISLICHQQGKAAETSYEDHLFIKYSIFTSVCEELQNEAQANIVKKGLLRKKEENDKVQIHS